MYFILLIASMLSVAEGGHSLVARDINGKIINTDDHKDKIIMLNFWATWCAPCMVEMPHLQEIQNKYKDDLLLISISVDEARDRSKIKPLMKTGGYDFVVIHDADRSLVNIYNPSMSLPYSVIIGYDREIIHQSAGYQHGKELIFEKILYNIIK